MSHGKFFFIMINFVMCWLAIIFLPNFKYIVRFAIIMPNISFRAIYDPCSLVQARFDARPLLFFDFFLRILLPFIDYFWKVIPLSLIWCSKISLFKIAQRINDFYQVFPTVGQPIPLLSLRYGQWYGKDLMVIIVFRHKL